jgi:DNA-binding NarL/FixJ family response regulator
MQEMKYRLGIIEDDIAIKRVFDLYFSKQENFELVLSKESMEDFLAEAINIKPLDIILSDIGLPGISGIEGIKSIKTLMPEVNIIMITIFEDQQKVFKALCAGASGYLLKSTPIQELAKHLLNIDHGGAPISPAIARLLVDYFNPKRVKSNLTAKELQIVQGLVDGLSYKLIADRLQISTHTVNSHIKQIYKKLHVNSKSEVIAKSLKGEIN